MLNLTPLQWFFAIIVNNLHTIWISHSHAEVTGRTSELCNFTFNVIIVQVDIWLIDAAGVIVSIKKDPSFALLAVGWK